MQFIVETLAALVVWAAGLAFAQFGIEVDLTRATATEQRVVERTSIAQVQPRRRMPRCRQGAPSTGLTPDRTAPFDESGSGP
jgi:hypothetical protein